jgi:transposase
MSLSPQEAEHIRAIITDRCPDQLKLPFALWTRQAVVELIRNEFGFDMPIRTVGEYLKRWGFTPQKPLKRAYERCPKAVERWVEQTYPAIEKQAKAEHGEIHWGDQTGLRSSDQVGRGYAPRGKTPVCPSPGTPEKVNMISTVTNQGKVRFMFYNGSMNAQRLIVFMRRLIKDARRKVFLILDNLRVHHAKKVTAWLADRTDQIEVFHLPSYSPDLNPDEYLNCDLKAGVSRKPNRRQKGHMRRTAQSHMRMLQRKPDRVRKYFHHPSIQYAA